MAASKAEGHSADTSGEGAGDHVGPQGTMGWTTRLSERARARLRQRSDGDHLRWRNRYDPCTLLWFAQVGPLVRWTFAYLQLQREDLMPTSKDFSVSYLLEEFNSCWQDQVKRKQPQGKKPSLLWALLRPHVPTLVFTGFLYAMHQGASFAGPLLLQQIVSALECRANCDGSNAVAECGCTPKDRLYLLAAALCIAPTVTSLAQSHQLFIQQQIGVKLKNKIVASLYRKTLNLSSSSLQEQTTGRLLTLFSNDAEKIQQLMFFLHGTWGAPVLIVVGLVVLYRVISWAAFVGFGALVFIGPLGGYVTRKLFEYRKKLVSFTDKRTNTISEAIGGIRVIKYYAWTKPFAERVNKARLNELFYLWRIAYFQSLFSVLPYAAPQIVAVISIGAYILFVEGGISASTAYTALSLINIIRLPLSFLPFIISNFLNALVSIGRLNNFFTAEECEKRDADNDEPGRVNILNGTFAWQKTSKTKEEVQKQPKERKRGKQSKYEVANGDQNGDTGKASDVDKETGFKLQNINIDIAPGSLCLIVGSTGSGKTALLNALSNWMEREEGQFRVSGTASFSSQTAWILNDTLQNNVLFGNDLDDDFYEHSVAVSQLGQDINSLPNGDSTEIGERGVNLSGGQKQRVSLARCVYANTDVVMLDDPLSAVDSHVGAKIFEQCIQDALADKTRLVVTNALHFLPSADHIIVMEKGSIKAQGSYVDLREQGVDFGGYVTSDGESGEKNEHGNEQDRNQEAITTVKTTKQGCTQNGSQRKLYKDLSVEPSLSKRGKVVAAEYAIHSGKKAPSKQQNDDKQKGSGASNNLNGDEERSVGAVSFWVYRSYVSAAGGSLIAIAVLMAYTVDAGTRTLQEYWLTFIANDEFNQPLGWYVTGYALLFVVNVCLLFNRGIATFFSAVAASKRLHEGLLARVLKLPMSFFDTTPSGRVINRFSRDMEILDTQIGGLLVQVLSAAFNILTSLIVISIATQGFVLVALPFLLVLYVMLQRIFVRTSRELQRLEAVTRSPIYSNFRETVDGIPIIRAFSFSEHFIGKNETFIQENARAFVNQKQASEWLSVRLDLLGTSILTLCGFLVIVVNSRPGIAGLALTYGLEITKFLKLGTTLATETETKFNSAERIVEYLNLRTEDEYNDGSFLPAEPLPEHWPRDGKVQLKGVSMRYRPSTPVVLDNVSFTVPPQAKVGICGRTGSGKSSLLMVLFRLVNIETGCVKIDDVDVGSLDLNYRSRIGMIPQDPFLFGGALRENIDPFDEYSDFEIWEALEHSNLKNLVKESADGLSMKITDNGSNLSQGQRQLMCMARALLRKCTIVALDEATSSIDVESDALIQRTLREQFSKATVLTIAHRINTIADSDFVLVMSDGKVAEFDKPSALLERDDSEYAQMVQETGQANFEYVRRIANAQARVVTDGSE